MNEDKLDKIIRLCYGINSSKGLNASFQIGYWYSGASPTFTLHIDSHTFQCLNVDAAIDKLESVYYDNTNNTLKNEILEKIEAVQYELNKYQETLAKLEEKHNAV